MDVVAVGEVMTEVLERVERFPPENTTVVIQPGHRPIGGAVVNVAWCLAQIGCSVQLVAAASQPDVAQLKQMYSALPVDLSGMVELRGSSDQLISLLTDEEHRSLYLLADLPDNYSPAVRRRVGPAAVLALNGGRHPEVRQLYRSLAEERRERLVGFNPSYAVYAYSVDELSKILAGVHVVVVNEQELGYLRDLLGWARLQSLVVSRGGVLITTAGSNGATAYYADKELMIRSNSPRVGVFLGAGDALFSGFLHSYARSRSVEDAMTAGMSAAAVVVETGSIRPDFQDGSGW
jgi:sugar/nucleoside kinase (ribokinase family)